MIVFFFSFIIIIIIILSKKLMCNFSNLILNESITNMTFRLFFFFYETFRHLITINYINYLKKLWKMLDLNLLIWWFLPVDALCLASWLSKWKNILSLFFPFILSKNSFIGCLIFLVSTPNTPFIFVFCGGT